MTQPPLAGPARGDRVLLGMGLAMLAYSLFSTHDAAVKWLVAGITVWQVLLVRSTVIAVGCLMIGGRTLLQQALHTPMKGPLALRAAITLSAWFCYFTASRSLPLAQMQTLYFAAPIIVTLLAVPLLGERITWSRLLAVSIGFTGVLLASDPLHLSVAWPPVLVLMAAALWALGIVLMRRIARSETSLLQMFFGNLLFAVVTAVGSVLTWRTLGWPQLGLLGVVGLLGFAGQFCMFESVRHAPATVTATLEYTSLVLAFTLGYLIWGDIPGLPVFAGAALILGAGTLLLLTERRASGR